MTFAPPPREFHARFPALGDKALSASTTFPSYSPSFLSLTTPRLSRDLSSSYMQDEQKRAPNYYKILEVAEDATTQQIRDAYKRAALKTHPDRVPADSPDRAARTRKFQLVNDAYYALSDASRRRDYDAQRRLFTGSSASYSDPFGEAEGTAGSSSGAQPQGAYSWAWNFFTNQGADSQARQEAENAQFGDVFEEMLREEGMAEPGTNQPTGRFWSTLGGLSGATMGFIVANVPGLLAGAVAGNRLGAVRDAKGKSVFAVFQELPQGDRARLLSQLAAKVFSHAVGM